MALIPLGFDTMTRLFHFHRSRAEPLHCIHVYLFVVIHTRLSFLFIPSCLPLYLMNGGSDLFFCSFWISHMLIVVIQDLCTLLCIVLMDIILEMFDVRVRRGWIKAEKCTRSNYTFYLEE